MGNNWFIPRNKRKLYPVVDVLSLFVTQNVGLDWDSNRDLQREFEDALERFGLKKSGDRRDGRAGGARTYEAWLSNLGLIFKETSTGLIRTTLAGEALLAGEHPVPIITNQLMKLQYPSPYSIRTGVRINPRFRIRPFRFLLRLLMDERIRFLTTEEIAYLIIPIAENESTDCYENIVERIIYYRDTECHSLPAGFNEDYPSRNGVRTEDKTLKEFVTIANTFINYLEYTQLIRRSRNEENMFIAVPPHARRLANEILSDGSTLRSLDVSRPFGLEIFQRNFGLAPNGNRDNRTFNSQVTPLTLYRNRRVRSEALHQLALRPITNITPSLLEDIASITGYTLTEVEAALEDFHPNTLSQFENNYLNMATSGKESARDFEIATAGIFEELGFTAVPVGTSPLHPDVFIESPLGFSGIIDTKAIRGYSPTNDHRNRMIRNYIPTYQERYSNLELFMYVADSFNPRYQSKIEIITEATEIDGSGITAYNLLQLLQRHLDNPINHGRLRTLLKNNSTISLSDIYAL